MSVDLHKLLLFPDASTERFRVVAESLLARRYMLRDLQNVCDKTIPALPCIDQEFKAIVEYAACSLFSGWHAEMKRGLLEVDLAVVLDSAPVGLTIVCYSVANLSAIAGSFEIMHPSINAATTDMLDLSEQLQCPALLETILCDACCLVDGEHATATQTTQTFTSLAVDSNATLGYRYKACVTLLDPGFFNAIAVFSSLLTTAIRDALDVHIKEIQVVSSSDDLDYTDDDQLEVIVVLESSKALKVLDLKSIELLGIDAEALISLIAQRTTDKTQSTIPDVYGRSLIVNSFIQSNNLYKLSSMPVQICSACDQNANTLGIIGKFIPVNG